MKQSTIILMAIFAEREGLVTRSGPHLMLTKLGRGRAQREMAR